MEQKKLSKIMIFLFIFICYVFIQIISNYQNKKPHIEYIKSKIRPSYGDEFYNYYGNDNSENNNKPPDNINEIIIEGFSFQSDEEAIRETHKNCPVMEGNNTQLTNCIQFPNNTMDGLPGAVDGGFLISVCCNNCINKVQNSLNNDDGIYKIIYKDDHYILTVNDEEKQVVFPCSGENISRIRAILEED